MSDIQRLRKELAPYFLTYEATRMLGKGTSFPASADIPGGLQDGDTFFRSDQGIQWGYAAGAAQWRTVQEYSVQLAFGQGVVANSYSATQNVARFAAIRNDLQPFWARFHMTIAIGATNSALNYITYNVVDSNGTTLWSVNTSADSPSTTVNKSTASPTQSASAINFVYLNVVVTGAPAAQFPHTPILYHRFIA